jgi:lipopolysaccharide export system protein LptA
MNSLLSKHFLIWILFLTLIFPKGNLLWAVSKKTKNSKPLAVFTDLKADSLEFKNDKQILILRGNAHIIRGDVKIFADVIEADIQKEKIFAYKNVDFWQGKKEVKAEMMVYNMKTGRGYMEHGYTYENRTGNNTFYYKIKKMYYQSTKQIGYDVIWTTCDHIDHPHYHLKAKKAVLIPDEKIILYHASYYLGGTKLFTVGMKVIPLNQKKRSKIKPGYSKLNGYYLESSYDYQIDKNNTGRLIFNYYQKRGIGWGINHNYKFRSKSSGSVYVYFFDEKREINGVKEDYNNSGRINIRNSYRLDPATTINTQLNYTTNKYPNYPAANEELTININANHIKKSYSIRLNLNDRVDMDGDRYTGDNNYRTFNRSPELYITTNNKKLWFLNINTRTLLGKYTETYNGTTKATFKKDITFNSFVNPISFFNIFKISLNNSYRRIFYDTGDDIESSYSRLGTNITLNKIFTLGTNYDYRTVWGTTPLSSDRMSSVNRMQNYLNYHWKFLSGKLFYWYYDFLNDRFSGAYSDLNISSQFKKVKWNFYVKGNYDLGDTKLNDWSPNKMDLTRLYGRLSFNNPEKKWNLLLASSYDAKKDDFVDLNSTLNFKIDDLFDVGINSRYDFSQKKTTSLNYNVKWNLHCFQAQMSWNKQTRDFMFMIYIKAFPDKKLMFNYDVKHCNTFK